MLPLLAISFLLESLLGSLGLLAFSNLGSCRLNDSDSNSLSHVTDSKSSKWWIFREGLNAHGLAWHQLYNSSISRLDELGVVFSRFTSTTVNLLLDLSKL